MATDNVNVIEKDNLPVILDETFFVIASTIGEKVVAKFFK